MPATASGKVDAKARCPRSSPTRPNAAREALIEMVAEADESLMEKFFEAGTLTQDELIKGLAAATRDAKIYPAGVHVGSARTSARSR